MRSILLILFLSPLLVFSQDIKGTYKGILYQDPDREYYFEIRVDEVDANGKVKGTTFVREESSGNYGTISYKGTYSKPTFKFNEIEILKQDKQKDGGYYASNTWFWCIKYGSLKFSESDGKYFLEGPWNAGGGCSGGTLKVSKPAPEKPKEPDCDELHSAEFMLGSWKGKFHQHACGVFETYPMVVMIDKFEGMKFYGQFIWTDMKYADDSRSTLEGEIKDGYAYFYENELISGGGLVLNGTYKAEIINCDEISGYWFLEKIGSQCNDPQVLKNGGDYDLEHYVIPTIYFDHNSSELRTESVAELKEFAKFLKDFPSMKFEMKGHTDNSGNNANNLILSRKRAQIVIDYLVSLGVKANRFTYTYYAHTEPAEKNDSEKNMQLNRRTEIILLPGK